MSEYGFETRAIHAGQDPDPSTGAVVPPLSLSTTFAQDGVGGHRGYDYARSGNPTRAALEAAVASLEGGRHGFAFASGLAAEDTILRLLSPGDRILLGDDAYGGTFRLIDKVYRPAGYPHTAVDLTDLAALERDWPADARLVWLESPTNPLLTCVDIAALAELAHGHGALVVVDNTFATPYLQQPLALGADIVVHSATKYLGGHSDVVGGIVVLDDDALAERIGFTQNATGAVPGPVRLLPGAARPEDTGRSDGPALRECRRGRRHARDAPGGLAGPVPGAARPPRPRRRPSADARLRRHGQLPARRRGARRRCRWPRAPACSRSPSRSGPSSP